jgi:aminopeptidase
VRDPRIDEYARLLVDRSIGVQAGWQVCIRGNHLGRPLLEAVIERIARRGAYPFLQLAFEQVGGPFAREAPVELLRVPSPLQRRVWEEMDAVISVWSPEDAHEGRELSEERQAALQEMARPLRERTMSLAVPWVIAEWPVQSLADDAGMTLAEYEQFIFDAVLLDWDAEASRMRGIADVFDGADEVRIVGPGTDLTLSLAGRTGSVDDGHINMPGGEVFYSPVEDSANGVIETLDTDAGARRLGELGIGCNPGIQRYMKNVGFDEKINGTVHLAVGNSYSFTGGRNQSAIHWDIVKDLRTAGRIYADGRLVQENGAWITASART